MSPLERAVALSAMQDARAAAVDAREEAERQVAREERQEALQWADRGNGGALGETSRARQVLANADDECADLADRLAKAEPKRDRARSGLDFWVQRQAQAFDAVQRSAPSVDGIEGALSRVQEAARQLQAERRVDEMLARAASRPAARSASSPKVREADCEICSAARAADRKAPPYSEFDGPSITRGGGYVVGVR